MRIRPQFFQPSMAFHMPVPQLMAVAPERALCSGSTVNLSLEQSGSDSNFSPQNQVCVKLESDLNFLCPNL
jgi:hypothetical protein